MRSFVFASALALVALCAAPALAQEVTSTAQPDDPAGQAIAEWGRRVMAGRSTADLDAPAAATAANAPGPDARRCASVAAASPDGKPHGEVWAGIGNHGYREVGGVVTQPLGPCASLTVAVDHVEGNVGGGPHRRR